MLVRSLAALLVFAVGCTNSAYSATVACKDPTTMDFAQGHLNLAGYSIGDVYRADGAKRTTISQLKVTDNNINTEAVGTQTLSMNQAFELKAGADVPVTVQAELKTKVAGDLKLLLKDAKKKTVTLDWLGWLNTNTETDKTFQQLSSAMGAPPGQVFVVNQVFEAEALELKFGSETLTGAEVKVIKVVNANVNVQFNCATTVAISKGRPFYSALSFGFDGKAFSPAAAK